MWWYPRDESFSFRLTVSSLGDGHTHRISPARSVCHQRPASGEPNRFSSRNVIKTFQPGLSSKGTVSSLSANHVHFLMTCQCSDGKRSFTSLKPLPNIHYSVTSVNKFTKKCKTLGELFRYKECLRLGKGHC